MVGRARAHLRWRQVVLFVAAMIVPCTVLLILGARTIEQERFSAVSWMPEQLLDSFSAGEIRDLLAFIENGE